MTSTPRIEIIAELCQNHNGDMAIVEEMVYAAAESGADYAKIQSMQIRELTHRPRFDEGLVENGVTKVIKRPFQPEYERLSKLDLTDDDHFKFLEICTRAKIKPMTTVFSRQRVPFVQKLGMDTLKLASFDCASLPLIRDIRRGFSGRLIVSTGVTFDSEIEAAAMELKGSDFALLHCISIYPTPLAEAHLNRIRYLKTLCPSVGISDHSNPEKDGVKLSAAAVSVGATIVEKHFTVLPKDKTRDGPVSVNPAQLRDLSRICKMPPAELRDYVKHEIPEAELMLGKERRELSPTELLNRDYYRGRFASKDRSGAWVYNWEDKDL